MYIVNGYGDVTFVSSNSNTITMSYSYNNNELLTLVRNCIPSQWANTAYQEVIDFFSCDIDRRELLEESLRIRMLFGDSPNHISICAKVWDLRKDNRFTDIKSVNVCRVITWMTEVNILLSNVLTTENDEVCPVCYNRHSPTVACESNHV